MLEAEIILDYNDSEIAEAIAKAVSPDNFKAPKGLTVKTMAKDGRVITHVGCKSKLSTFIATVDDLLFCFSTAEKVAKTARKLK